MRLVAARGSLDVGRGGEKREEGREGMRYFLVLFFSCALGFLSPWAAAVAPAVRVVAETCMKLSWVREKGGGSLNTYLHPSIHPIAYLFPTLDWDGPQ